MNTARRLRWIAAFGGAALVATVAYATLELGNSVETTRVEDSEHESPRVHFNLQAPPGLNEILGAKAEVAEDTPEGQLVLAAREGDVGRVRELLTQGVSPDAQEPKNGHRALHQAALAKQAQAVDLLLTEGAAVDGLDGSGQTPLMWAAQAAAVAVGRRLLDSGAAVNARSEPVRETALSQLASGALLRTLQAPADKQASSPEAEIEFARMLFERGADPNLRSEEGSPLKALAIAQNGDLLTLFVEHGATIEGDPELAMLAMTSGPIGNALRSAQVADDGLPR